MNRTPDIHIRDFLRQRKAEKPAPLAKKKGKPRFARSAPEERTFGGTTFASKCEMEFHRRLLCEREIHAMWWCRQPLFDLAGATYKADFLVVRNEGVTVYEVKPRLHGRFRQEALRTFKRNQKQVRALYGIDVVLIEM